MIRMVASLTAVVLFFFAAGRPVTGQDSLYAQPWDEWPKITLTPRAAGLLKPTHIGHAGDGSKRLFVTEQRGRIIVLKDFVAQKTAFLDITGRVNCCGERGLLSAAFPYGYADKRYFYVDYTDKAGDTIVARYRVTSDPDMVDPKSEEIILAVKQPYANHNGGQLAFGPDGHLYIGMGDGGLFGDPHGYAQNPKELLGKILRIDVESGSKPYSIPPENPFVRKAGYRPEIWALGMRNPWRFSFDRKTGDLYTADVGQNSYEEVDFQPQSSRGGENYGWNIMEGAHCYKPGKKCDTTGLVPSVAEYGHDKGCSITGGMVYRGREFPSLQGIYFYADYCSGRIWGLRKSGERWEHAELLKSGHAISTFGEDEEGNLYIADHEKGAIFKIEAITRADRARGKP